MIGIENSIIIKPILNKKISEYFEYCEHYTNFTRTLYELHFKIYGLHCV